MHARRLEASVFLICSCSAIILAELYNDRQLFQKMPLLSFLSLCSMNGLGASAGYQSLLPKCFVIMVV